MIIERVPSFKLLGVTFNENLTWNAHVKNAITKAYGTLKSLALIKRYLPYRLRCQLAETLVLSKLDYGNAVFNNAPDYLFKQLQKIQNAAASFVRKSYSRETDVIAMKWLPVKERSDYSMARLAWKSVNMGTWPKFLPMEKYEQPITRNDRIGGTKLRESLNINGSRHCLSKVSEIFDPTEKMTPITAGLKLDLHELVNHKLQWDDVLPDSLRSL
ncbi:uncharacterized protein [Clytia hemisphaerica]|uniref:uncharacterized protein n=1 Tax=Clytia hemisphaerica TaxID=252671 RepID=UPI0034D41CBA